MLAGGVILAISSLGLFYFWHSAREAQLDAVRTELVQLARVAATQVDGDLHKAAQVPGAGRQPRASGALAPLVKFHKATSDIIYVYTAILDKQPDLLRARHRLSVSRRRRRLTPDPIMTPHDTPDPALRRALEQHEAAVNDEPVKETLRSYMSAYAPFYDRAGRFVGVVGIDMWVRDFDARLGGDSPGRHRAPSPRSACCRCSRASWCSG